MSFAEGLAFTKPGVRALILAFVSPLFLAAAMGLCGHLLGADFEKTTESAFGDLVKTGTILFVITVIVAGPVEELFYRGFVFGHLTDRFGPTMAIFMTSILFALVHVSTYGPDMLTICLVLLLAVVLALQRYYSGSTIPGMITHAMYNGICAISITAETSGQ